MAANMDTVDLLLVGKTGNGKSALGNSILRRKAFQSRNSTMSVTKTAEFDFSEFEGRIIKVVDGPGVGDTDLDPQEAAKLVVDAMSYAICANTQGFHAILVVVRYGGRFTKEDVDTLVILKQIFGEKFISDHAILVMTGGDNFKKDAADSGQTFENWCAEQSGVFIELFRSVRGRAVMFNNKTKDENLIYKQLRRLLAMVDSVGARYNSDMFREARKTRDTVLMASKRPTLSESAILESGLITQLLGKVDFENPANGQRQLQDLKRRTDALIQDITEQDKGSNCLAAAKKMAQNLKETIAEQLQGIKRILDGMQQDESETLDEDRHGQDQREAEVKKTATVGVKLQALQLDKEVMEKNRQEADRRDWQSTREERQRAAEKLAKEREQRGDQMTSKELRREARNVQEHHKLVMADLKKKLQEKAAKLEVDYQEVKEETRSKWLQAAPQVFSKLWEKISKLWKSK